MGILKEKENNHLLFSFIVPAYNAEQYIENCLDSLLDQEIFNYEIILINDGSTDRTGKICDDYADKFDAITVIHKENSGLQYARNLGLDKARGEYILFVDSDDSINKVLHEIKETADTVNCDVICLDGRRIVDGEETERLTHNVDYHKVYNSRDYLLDVLKDRPMRLEVPLYCYKRDFLNKHHLRFTTGIYHGDNEFTPKMLMAAESIYSSGILFYNYYKREGSISEKKDQSKNSRDIIYLCNKMKKEFAEVEDPELRFWLEDLLMEYYHQAILRSDLSPFRDKELLQSFSYEGMLMTPLYRKRMFFIFKTPIIYELYRGLRIVYHKVKGMA